MRVANITEPFSIQRCPLCGRSHESLQATPYKTPTNLGTHWCICPTTGDPFGLSFFAHDDSDDILILEQDLLEQLSTAFACPNWMIALFSIEEESDVIKLFRTTHSFPHAKFEESVVLLRNNLMEEIPHTRSMPEAIPRPRVNLFGPGDDNNG